ncbi:Achaete-scute 4 [Clonorchis sinensis]|nr:Achaete-scute 4 [Clonorchis sinensis]
MLHLRQHVPATFLPHGWSKLVQTPIRIKNAQISATNNRRDIYTPSSKDSLNEPTIPMRASQPALPFPTGLFPPNSYEQLHPFLAVAAAAAEVNQPKLQAYSAYYDAVTREASQRFGFYPTSSTLAAAIMGTTNVPPNVPYENDAAIICNSLSYARLHTAQNSLPPASPNFSSNLEPYITIKRPENPSNKSFESDEMEKMGKPAKPQRGSKRNSTRLTQTWPCNCSCPPDDDECSPSTNSRHNSDCSSPIHTSTGIEQLAVSVDSHNGTLPPFECAKSFIRRRNARERERVRCVNAGYESLRRRLPLNTMPDRRLAKVEILRGAINYIKALKELLEK